MADSAENDARSEQSDRVRLCTWMNQSGYCSLPQGHDGTHVFPPGTGGTDDT